MKNKQAINKKKKFFFYAVMLFIPFAFFFVGYISYVAYRSTDIYQYIKTNQRGWEGRVHAADAELGFSPVPNSYGAHVFPIGPDIPMRYDEDGFRVPIEAEGPSKYPRPLILSLGGSFTYGDATYAKDTFPFLVGQSLKGTSKNAGVSSYGLSQMLLLAKKLIPIYKPDYLLVQYSTWLVGRAQSPFAPAYYGKLPTPFFYEKDNSFALNAPIFLTKILELPVQRYRNTPDNFMDAFSFFVNVGFPLFFHDDFNMLKYTIDRGIGTVPNPTRARVELIEYVFSEINNIAMEHGTKLVIVALGKNAKPVEVNNLSFPSNAVFVNAQEVLLRRIALKYNSVNDLSYWMEYAHWRGSPPRIVDLHPNEAAHKIIADAIVSEIRQAAIQ